MSLTVEQQNRADVLYASGLDTYDIAKRLFVSEAAIYSHCFAHRQISTVKASWPQRDPGEPSIGKVGAQ